MPLYNGKWKKDEGIEDGEEERGTCPRHFLLGMIAGIFAIAALEFVITKWLTF